MLSNIMVRSILKLNDVMIIKNLYIPLNFKSESEKALRNLLEFEKKYDFLKNNVESIFNMILSIERLIVNRNIDHRIFLITCIYLHFKMIDKPMNLHYLCNEFNGTIKYVTANRKVMRFLAKIEDEKPFEEITKKLESYYEMV